MNNPPFPQLLYEKQTEHKIYKDKLFPKMPGVNVNNLKIDYECISFVTIPSESKKIAEITKKHIGKYKKSMKDVTILDATACVGGDTITFCNTFGKVIAIELDPHRFENLNFNLQQYKFTNVETLNGDSIAIIPKLTDIDIISIDCPWGGKDYKTQTHLRLQFGDDSLEAFILNCFNKDITPSQPKLLISKMPSNYDLEYLYNQLSPNLEVILYKLKKMNILAIERKNTNSNITELFDNSVSVNVHAANCNSSTNNVNNSDISATNTIILTDDELMGNLITTETFIVNNTDSKNVWNNDNNIWNTEDDFSLEQCVKTNISFNKNE